jgi:putative membrane protein
MLTTSLIATFGQMHWGGEWDQAGWFWMALMMIGGAILVVVVVWLLMRPFYDNTNATGSAAESPLDIAKRRYAAGEITEEEFEKIKDNIKGSG